MKPIKSILFVFSLFFMLSMIAVPDMVAQSFAMKPAAASMELMVKLDEYLNDYQAFRYESCLADEVRETGRLLLELDGQPRLIHLQPNNLRAPEMQRTVTTSEGTVLDDLSPVYTYRGYVADLKNSRVRLMVAPEYFSGWIQADKEIFFVESAARFLNGANTDMFVIYKNTDVKQSASRVCGWERLKRGSTHIEKTGRVNQGTSGNTWYLLQLAIEADEEFSRKFCPFYKVWCVGQINNIIESYVNQLDGIWERDLQLRAQLTYLNVYMDTDSNPATDSDPYNAEYAHGLVRLSSGSSTCVDPDPQDPRGVWEKFSDYWNFYKTHVPRDVTLLFTGRDLWLCPGENPAANAWDIFGTAGYDSTVCRQPSRAYVVMEEYPTNTVGLMAHEIGHSIGFNGHDSDPSCAPGGAVGPVLCGTVEAGSSYYSQASIDTIRTYFYYYNSCLNVINPEISVNQGSTFIPDGGTFAFPSTSPGVPVSLTFTIQNTAMAGLEISNTTSLVSGSSCFTQTADPITPVYQGGNTTFSIRFNCAAAGSYSAQVTISSNDLDEDPYNFTVTGTVLPAIQTVSFPVVADATVSQISPNLNMGSYALLLTRYNNTGNGYSSYLKFTVANITRPIQSAKLKLRSYVNFIPTFHIYHIKNTTWGEYTITWNNAPLDFYSHFSLSSLAASTWYEFDVTSMVSGNGTYTFGLTASDLPNLGFRGRESSYKPELIVTY